MANSLVQYTCCLIILTTFVDRGDGRWKKKDRESLQRDIELFRRMSDKIEYEIESYYDEYSEEKLTDNNSDRTKYKYGKNTLSHFVPKNLLRQNEIKQNETRIFLHNKTNNVIPTSFTQMADSKAKGNEEKFINKTQIKYSPKEKKYNTSRWPTFDDILLAIGKRYDWKNDRWIKMKGKLKKDIQDQMNKNHIDFYEKHKFKYRIVKLNKSKNRRKVVVAVSAVR